MASIYKREKSAFWWLKWKNPDTASVERFSTGCRIGIGSELVRARRIRDEHSVKENPVSFSRTPRWGTWVPAFFESRYSHQSATLGRVLTAWRPILQYLESIQIHEPRLLRRSHCYDYLPWRKRTARKQSISQNTILLELKVLSVVMDEAVNRFGIQGNPVLRLGMKKKASRPKPEMTETEIAAIRSALADPSTFAHEQCKWDWHHIMSTSFEIAIHQGCRLSETWLNLKRDLDLSERLIHFHAKGDKYYSTRLNPALVPLFQRLLSEGRIMTYDPPPQRTMLSLKWHKLFKSLGLGHLSFHCTRVTCISRLERAGAPEKVVMDLVNHASTTVHRIYRRSSAAELDSFWQRADTKPSSENPDALAATPETSRPASESHA